MTSEPLATPVSTAPAERLAALGLRMSVLDPADAGAVDGLYDAVARGFSGPEPDDGQRARFRDDVAPLRRSVGVWDDTLAAPEPVATVLGWPAELGVPGDRTVPTWAIGAVTVAPTHRRRGIARALIEDELRTAAGLGIPLASLTVSEATIYSRFGFGPAASVSQWRIDTRRAGWAGPTARSRVEFADRSTARRELEALHERVRGSRPGEVDGWGRMWDQLCGIDTSDQAAAKRLRFVLARDESGAVRGAAVYSVREEDSDFRVATVQLVRLDAETDDANAALWRFLLELDLVDSLTAELRPVDDPVRWMLADQRAAIERRGDHEWLRILDVGAALEGRGYVQDGSLGLEVSDAAGFAGGTRVLRVEGGAPRVEEVDALPDRVPALALDVSELSSLYLGGVRAATLVGAGRIRELVPGSADAADALLRSPVTPWLSFWY